MDQSTITTEVKKSGELPIIISQHRHRAGILLTVKTLPQVEEFFRDLGSGASQPVANHGRNWFAVGANPLMVYDMGKNLGTMIAEDEGRFTLDRPGQPLWLPDPNTGAQMLNLSFLRLVGISEGDGVSFTVKGAQTLDEMRRTSDRVKFAARRFYINFLRPVSISVFVSTQEMRG